MKLILELDYMPFSHVILHKIDNEIDTSFQPLIWNNMSYCIIDFDMDDITDIEKIVSQYDYIIERKTLMDSSLKHIPIDAPIHDIFKLRFKKCLTNMEIKELYNEGINLYKRLLEK